MIKLDFEEDQKAHVRVRLPFSGDVASGGLMTNRMVR